MTGGINHTPRFLLLLLLFSAKDAWPESDPPRHGSDVERASPAHSLVSACQASLFSCVTTIQTVLFSVK
jgi:hypothetical protein